MDVKSLNRVDSLDDDLNDDDKNLSVILKKFKSLNDNQDLGNTEQYLIDSLYTETNVCLICIESVDIKQPIWNCEGCYAQFHIVCIQNWIREGSYLAIANNFDQENKPKNVPWNCPKCRKEYKQEHYPSAYYCYCKKVKDPKFDPWSIPHSCNQKCDKSKPCGHNCLTLCHPGPCPPCPKMVMNSCYCGKSNPVSRRCSNKAWSCHKTCNHLLSCKQHLCAQICHPGACNACEKTSLQFCNCKKKRKMVLCTETEWHCEQKCSKPYSCGYHECQLTCHDGECGPCPKSLIRTCPCGKTKSTKPCNEDIPTCGDTCNKKLSCDLHNCAMRCHYGPCETCRQLVVKKCRCGQKEKTLPCFTEFTCESKCNKMRNCGKHKCNRKCCEGNCPPCEQVCNKQLSCKNHKCKNLCHSGACYPCPIMEEISCPCGTTKIKVPCYKSKEKVRVPCKYHCNFPAKCHHEKIQPHRCHYGDCPPCKLACGIRLECNHICQAQCHSAVLTEIIENKDREGPWVPLTRKKVYMNLKCKECTEPIRVRCLGNHEIGELPCYRAKPYNCGRKCGRPLKCSHHRCELECHFILDKELNEKDKASSNCEVCERPCEQTRPKGCEHDCLTGVCHPNRCPDCTKLNKSKCHCGSNFVYVECNKWTSANTIQKEELKSCKVPCSKTLSCGHSCTLVCHPGKCSSESQCQSKVTIRCKCKKLKRSVICNQMSTQTDLILIKDKYFLNCTEKCAVNSTEPAPSHSDSNETDQLLANKSSDRKNSLNYVILAAIFLFVSILIYFYLASN